jgi:hypothetical protein
MKFFGSLFIALFLFALPSSAQSWIWGREGNMGPGYSPIAAADNSGNVIMMIRGGSTLAFGNDTIVCPPNCNAVIVKYDSNGNELWATQGIVGASGGQILAYSVATDKFGNIFLTGTFSDTASFDSHIIYSPHSTTFLAKYDGNGNAIWARAAIGSSGGNSPVDVSTDSSGNIFVAGGYVDQIIYGTDTLHGSPNHEYGFIVKFDSNGNEVWLAGASTSYLLGINSIATDLSGSIYISGVYEGAATFGSITISNYYAINAYVAKYDSNGIALWVRVGIPANDGRSSAQALTVATDSSGNVYTAGMYTDTLSFGSYSFFSDSSDIFFVKYSTTGNLQWAQTSTHAAHVGWWKPGSPRGLSLNNESNIYLSGVGEEANHCSIAFGSDTLKIINNPTTANFIMEFDFAGNALCGSIFRVYANCGEDAVAADPTGKFVYLAANLYDTTTFGPDLLGPFPYGQLPIVARWQACDSKINAVDEVENNNSELSLYPNPSSGIIHLEANNIDAAKATFTVMDVTGRIIIEQEMKCNNKNISISFDLSNVSAGMYVVELRAGEKFLTTKLVKQ